MLLELLPNGVVYYTPVLGAGGEVVDFQLAYRNAAAQRLLDLPAPPAATYLQQWPGSAENGAFAFHRDTYLAGTPAQSDQLYPAGGNGGVIGAHATRLDGGLLVTLTESNEPATPAVAVARRETPPYPPQAHAEADAQRAVMQGTLEQAPLAIAILDGPTHVVTFANEGMERLWGRPVDQVIGQAHFEALPDLAG